MNGDRFLSRRQGVSAARRPAGAAALLLAALLGAAAPAQAVLTVYNDAPLWAAALAPGPAPTLIDFDALADDTPLAAQFAGVGFVPFNGGNPLVKAFNFSQTLGNLVALGTPPLTGGGGGVAMVLGQPVQGIGFWYLDSEFAGNQVAVLDSAGQVLGNFELAVPHPAQWQFIGFVDSGNAIRRVEVAIGAADMVALDSLQISAAVPEPASAALLLAGIVMLASKVRLGGLRRRAAR